MQSWADMLRACGLRPWRGIAADVTASTKKGRLRCHKRPKSREETPKEGSDSGGYRTPLPKTIATTAQLNVGKRRASKAVRERYEGLWRCRAYLLLLDLPKPVETHRQRTGALRRLRCARHAIHRNL